MNFVIRLESVSFSYRLKERQLPIFSDLSLNLSEGSFVGLRGPSGSGKSTLFFLLSGFVKPQQGRVLIGGRDFAEFSEWELASFQNKTLGFVFQQFHLLPHLNVLENILLPSRYPSEDKVDQKAWEKRALELASQFGLSGRLDHLPHQLSGGQQQRVALARALLKDPPIVLADEPTGNLDSQSAKMVLDYLGQVHSLGKTVVLISHDEAMFRDCDRVIELRDGQVIRDEKKKIVDSQKLEKPEAFKRDLQSTLTLRKIWKNRLINLWPLAVANLWRYQRTRTVLTLLGVSVGVSSLLAMLTFGSFVRTQLIFSYEKMGVNKIAIRGYYDWGASVASQSPHSFREFSMDSDVPALLNGFPEIEKLSPVVSNYNSSVIYFRGKSFERSHLVGVDEDYLEITSQNLLMGRNFSSYHIDHQAEVCVIGHGVWRNLFSGESPIGQVINYTSRDHNSVACRVVGLLNPLPSNQNRGEPDNVVLMPYTTFRTIAPPWYRMIGDLLAKVRVGVDIEPLGKAIVRFFQNKYGSSGAFSIGSDTTMVAQLKKFLGLFQLLMGLMALMSLFVGGLGLSNMMLASLSEQIREIGVRKAHGATHTSLMAQLFLQSFTVCGLAGLVGLVLGFGFYQILIYLSSQVSQELTFQWVVDPLAMSLSFFAIGLVGLASGLIPALKAKHLEVIEALRSE